jgi:WS/DGAT C-terminal domain
MGHKMLTWYPYVPIGGEMGINCAILTYNGTAYFGFTTDMHAAPDANLLEQFVPQAFAEMRNSFSIKEGRPIRRRKPRKMQPSPSPIQEKKEKNKQQPRAEAAVAD